MYCKDGQDPWELKLQISSWRSVGRGLGPHPNLQIAGDPGKNQKIFPKKTQKTKKLTTEKLWLIIWSLQPHNKACSFQLSKGLDSNTSFCLNVTSYPRTYFDFSFRERNRRWVGKNSTYTINQLSSILSVSGGIMAASYPKLSIS